MPVIALNIIIYHHIISKLKTIKYLKKKHLCNLQPKTVKFAINLQTIPNKYK